jgi:hypothetical protein
VRVNQGGQEIMMHFHNQIHKISTFRDIQDDFSKWPPLLIEDVFKDSEDRKQFQQAILELVSFANELMLAK